MTWKIGQGKQNVNIKPGNIPEKQAKLPYNLTKFSDKQAKLPDNLAKFPETAQVTG